MTIVGGVCWALLTSAAPAQDQSPDQDPQQVFNSLFGADVQRVKATGTYEDDLELGSVLLQSAAVTTGQPEMVALLIEHTVELSMTHPEGYDQAAEAIEFGLDLLPEQQLEYVERLVELRQRQYTQTRGGDRVEAGKALAGALQRMAEIQQEHHEYDAALVQLRRASAVASAVRSNELRQSIRRQMDRAVEGQAIQRKIQSIRSRLKQNKEDQDAARELLRLYVVEQDNPEQARKFSFLYKNENWQTNIRNANADLTTLSDQQLIDLANWYRQLAGEAESPASQARMFARTIACCDHYLEANPDAGLLSTRLQLTRDQSAQMLATINQKLPPDRRVQPSDYGAWLRVIPLIDISEHTDKGQFRRLGQQAIQSLSDRAALLVLPIEPIGAYELSIRFRPAYDAYRDIVVHLPVGSTSVTLHTNHRGDQDVEDVGVFEAEEPDAYAGLAVFGEHSMRSQENPTRRQVEWLGDGKSHTLRITVKPQNGDAMIRATMDDVVWVDTTAPLTKLNPDHAWQPAVGPAVPAIGVDQAVVDFESIRVRTIQGQLKPYTPQGEQVAEVEPGDEREKLTRRERMMKRMDKMREQIDARWDRMSDADRNNLALNLLRNPNPLIRQLGQELVDRIEDGY